jgi:hypothetical protein
MIAPDFRRRKPGIRKAVKLRDTRLTPPDFVQQVVSVLGEIELDPCGHRKSFVPATRQYFEEDDGLSQEWKAKTVFVNPPYSMAAPFMRKAHAEWLTSATKRIIASLLINGEVRRFSKLGLMRPAIGRLYRFAFYRLHFQYDVSDGLVAG